MGIQLRGGTGAFLGVRGVGLRDLVHLGHGDVDLANPVALFLGGRGDAGNEVIHFADVLHDRGKRGGDLGADVHAARALLHGVFDLRGGFLGGLGAALGEAANTSSATTAKPMPASPARAASTAALRARRFVWKAISSICLDDLGDVPAGRF